MPKRQDRPGSVGETYHTGQRVSGGVFVDRLNPAIVSSHINADIGAKHLPFPLVRKTTGGNQDVREQDAQRRDRIMIPEGRFRK